MTATLRLAVPVIVVQVGLMVMGVVDTVMVGRVSATALAAVALGNLYVVTVTVFGMGSLMALDPIVSQAVGAGDRAAVARGIQRGLLFAVALSLPTAVLLLPGVPLLTALRQPPDVVPIAAKYALVSIPGTLPFFAFVVLRQSLQAMARVTPVVVTIIAANVANALLNWMLVFGKLGVPPLGAVGSGWATSISRWLMALALFALSWKLLRPYVVPLRRDAFLVKPVMRMAKLGAPIGVQVQLEFGAFGIIALLMGWFGTIEMAGHQVAISLASLTFMVPMGLSTAAAVRVGHGVGRGEQAAVRRAAVVAIACGASFMAGSGTLLLILPQELARLYTTDMQVIAMAALLIPIAGVFQVFDGLQVVAVGVLRGVGDTRAPMIVSVLGFWLIGVPVSLYLGFRTDAGPTGLWWGLVAGLFAVATFLLGRVRYQLSRDLRRIDLDDEQVDG